MSDSTQDWTCSGCGRHVDETTTGKRRPCPKCGAVARTAHVTVAQTVTVAVHLKTHAKHRDGGTKVRREIIEGDDFHRKTGRWNLMRRVIDRTSNWYEETFRDRDSGAVVHHTAEPLTEHKKPKAD
jgi:predicted RNA-binding Zn-ribbon protein involved in translation (DUF1610 family)